MIGMRGRTLYSWSAPLLSLLSLSFPSLSSHVALVSADASTKFGTSGVTNVLMTYTGGAVSCTAQSGNSQNVVRYEWTISQTDSSSATAHQPQDTTGTPLVTLTFNHELLTVGNSYPAGTTTTFVPMQTTLNQTTVNYGPNVVQEITFYQITCANYQTLYYTISAQAPVTGTTSPMVDFPIRVVDSSLPTLTPAPTATTQAPTTKAPTTLVPTTKTPTTSSPTTKAPTTSTATTPAPATRAPTSTPTSGGSTDAPTPTNNPSMTPTSTSPPATPTPTGPAVRCTTWRVRSNDTLSSIADKFHITVASIVNNNPEITNDIIIIGQILKVVCPATPDSDAIANEGGSNPSPDPQSSSSSSSSTTIKVVAIIVPIGVILLFVLVSVLLVRYRRAQYHDHVNKLRLQQLAENSPSPSTIPSKKAMGSRSVAPKQEELSMSPNPAATAMSTSTAPATALSSLFLPQDTEPQYQQEAELEPEPQLDPETPDNYV